MLDFEIKFTGVQQIALPQSLEPAPGTCKVLINFNVTGPKSGIDNVQVYAVNAVDTISAGLGNVVDTVDMQIQEYQYTSLVAILADGINLGLTRMSEACRETTWRQLSWTADWHVREDREATPHSLGSARPRQGQPQRGEGNFRFFFKRSKKKLFCSARSAFAKLKQQIRGTGTLPFLNMQQSLERTYAKVAF
jgi:Tn3 transposase DDE domain